MDAIISNIKLIFPFVFAAWTIFALSVWRKPQKYFNSFLLLIALGFTVFFVAGLFGDKMGDALIIMFLFFCLLIFLVPLMLMINGVVMIKKEGLALAHVLSLLLGIFVGAGEIAVIIGILGSTELFSIVNWQSLIALVFASVFYVSFLILAFVIYIFFMEFLPHKMNFDYIIIHGCGLIDGNKMSKILENRTIKAMKIFEKCNSRPIIIPSGGKGSDESISEAEAMATYLLDHGVPNEKIILEDKSETTMENLINSKNIIMSREGTHNTCLVSTNYHIYRCLVYAKQLNLKCTGIGSRVAFYFWPSAVIREFIAIFSMKKNLIIALLGYLFFVGLPFMTTWF